MSPSFGLFELAYFIHYVPRWFWVSTLITLAHTADEANGEIWNFLRIPAWLYFLFQAVVLYLGFLGNLYPGFGLLFILVRAADLVYTHIIRQAPGLETAPLLLLDALVVAGITGYHLA